MAFGRRSSPTSSPSNSFLAALLDFSYDPLQPGDWATLACQVTVASCFIVLVKALDGEVCGQPVVLWIPPTWFAPFGCTVRSLVKNVPNNFLHYPGSNAAPPAQPGNLIAPPAKRPDAP